jgi:heptosyltransferase-1
MRVLIVKISSLGDLIHSFPALTDAATARPEITFDWLVDQSFAEVPAWHPAVQDTISLNLRHWKKQPRVAWKNGEFGAFIRCLRQHQYDLIIDAQGLLKSALPAALARGPVIGYDRHSIREPAACIGYQQRYTVSREWHAIQRIRSLYAQALNYPLSTEPANYGLNIARKVKPQRPKIMLLHGSSWPNKVWPLAYWVEFARLASTVGEIVIPGHTAEEQHRAHQIAQLAGTGQVLPPLSLNAMAEQIATSSGIVGQDSGLAHLAAAMQIPAVTLYGPTQVGLSGAIGKYQVNQSSQFQCAPCMQRTCGYTGKAPVYPACFAELTPKRVWQQLQQQMAKIA